MTSQTATRKTEKPLTRGEVMGLMRRSYNAPIPPPLPLHVMAKRRRDLADTTTNTEEISR